MRLALGAVLEPALVAAQPLLDLQQRLVGAGIGVGRIGFGLQRDAGIQMQRAVGAEAEAVLAERDVAGIIAVEIFAQDFFGAFADAPAQRFADTDAFARDPYGHVMPRFSKSKRSVSRLAEADQAGAMSRDRSEGIAGAESALPSILCLSRRRCTEDGMRIASRYFATVRRAISMPASRNRSTMVSSDRIAVALSASINCLIW